MIEEPHMAKITAISMHRSRAEAATQRRLGLKVGGTMTEFSVSDGEKTLTIDAWGATPAVRASAAKKAFIQGSTYYGPFDPAGQGSMAIIRGAR